MRRLTGIVLALAAGWTGPAAPAMAQEAGDGPDVAALLRAAEGSGDGATQAADTLRSLPPSVLQPFVSQFQKGSDRARRDVLAARAARVRSRAKAAAKAFGKEMAALRKQALRTIRGYQKPQQPEVDRLVKAIRALIYEKIPQKDLVSAKFSRAHVRYDLFQALLGRVGARNTAHGTLARELVELDRATMLQAWMGGSHIKIMNELEKHREFLDREEYACVKATNAYRAELGLRPLRVDRKLVICGRKHSEEMKRLGYFSHTSPVKGREHYGSRASQEGTSAATENIAAGQSTGRGAFDGWYHSPGHHQNMIGGHSRMGVGRHGGLWTELFG